MFCFSKFGSQSRFTTKSSLPQLNTCVKCLSLILIWSNMNPYPAQKISSTGKVMCHKSRALAPYVRMILISEFALGFIPSHTAARYHIVCWLITIHHGKKKLHLDKLIWQAWRFNFYNTDTADKIQAHAQNFSLW